ncbi:MULTISPECIES: azurin [unclassified Lysobacter]|uniref:azurin n=1 Tax=unclassified Lysobacter TaxID=2635362 RepID=UPI001C24924E|nr:azurin [Lysobacter sp. MMG2]MBU8977896.1 azurin [Lysobacter sp. MMG2]
MKSALLLSGLLMAGMSSHAFANACVVKITSDDAMRYDIKTATVSASCPTITFELTHAGKLPVTAMGHNVVVSQTVLYDAIARDGLKAGAASGYVMTGDTRVIAATAMIGGGQQAKTSFAGSRLSPGGDYAFYCTFPGHATQMRGKLLVVK